MPMLTVVLPRCVVVIVVPFDISTFLELILWELLAMLSLLVIRKVSPESKTYSQLAVPNIFPKS